MADLNDNPKFKEWETAHTNLQKRKAYYESAKVFPKEHPLRQICKWNVEKAQAAYANIVNELQSRKY